MRIKLIRPLGECEQSLKSVWVEPSFVDARPVCQNALQRVSQAHGDWRDADEYRLHRITGGCDRTAVTPADAGVHRAELDSG